MPPESSIIGEVQKPRIPLDTLVSQVDATNRSGGLDTLMESRRPSFSEVPLVLVKRHQVRPTPTKSKHKNNKETGRDCTSN